MTASATPRTGTPTRISSRPARPAPAAVGRPDRSVGESIGAALVFAGVTLTTAWLGSVATASGRPWYEALDDPGFAPPDATFGIVWTVLYVAIAVAGWRAWRATSAPSPTVAWAVQMALNLAWTLVFFGSESLVGGLVVIAVLIVAVAVDLWRSWRVDRVAGALLVPYLAWVCFAAALNVGYLALD